MTMEDTARLNRQLYMQVELVNEILERYINDEVGESQKDKFNAMTNIDKIDLLTFTLKTCPCWDDFETELVINFDMCNFNN